jgi:FkbM family methyltransferase
MSINRSLRKSLNRVGWDVRRVDPRCMGLSHLAHQLSIHQIEVVFDVGANTGQFAQQVREAGFPGRIVSFEPSASAHAMLVKQARRDANWIVAPRMALGDHDGTIALNLAENSVSSSVLPMLPMHANAAPESRYVSTEVVNLCTLDSVSKEFTVNSERIFLKLDVQGFEYKVLVGAQQLLHRVAGLQLELSLVPLYEGEHLFHPMLHDLEERGYDLWSVVPGFVDPHSGRLLQVDAIFFRSEPTG